MDGDGSHVCTFVRTSGPDGPDDAWVRWGRSRTGRTGTVRSSPRTKSWYRRVNRPGALPFEEDHIGECRMYLEPEPPPSPRERREWVVKVFGKEEGPYTLDELESGSIIVTDSTTGEEILSPLLPTTLVARMTTYYQQQTINYGITSQYESRVALWQERSADRIVSSPSAARVPNEVVVEGTPPSCGTTASSCPWPSCPGWSASSTRTARGPRGEEASTGCTARSSPGTTSASSPARTSPTRLAWRTKRGTPGRVHLRRLHGLDRPAMHVLLGVAVSERAHRPDLPARVVSVVRVGRRRLVCLPQHLLRRSRAIHPRAPTVVGRRRMARVRRMVGAGLRRRRIVPVRLRNLQHIQRVRRRGRLRVRRDARSRARGRRGRALRHHRRAHGRGQDTGFGRGGGRGVTSGARPRSVLRRGAGVSPARRNSSGAVWSVAREDVNGTWESEFVFFVHEQAETCVDVHAVSRSFTEEVRTRTHRTCRSAGGDGFAFVLRDDTDDAPGRESVGAPGPGLGYQGLRRSLAVEFDTWHNPLNDEPYERHVAVHTNGAEPNDAHHGARLGSTVDVPDLRTARSTRSRVVLASGGMGRLSPRPSSPATVRAPPLDSHTSRERIRGCFACSWTTWTSRRADGAAEHGDGAATGRVHSVGGIHGGTGESWQAVDLVSWNFTSYG